MSKKEIYDLLEIHSPENDFRSEDKGQNIVKHFLIRIFSVFFIIGAILLFTEFADFGMNDNIAILFGCAIIFIIWFFFLVIEAIVLQVRKKFILRNVNLTLIGFVLLVIAVFTASNL